MCLHSHSPLPRTAASLPTHLTADHTLTGEHTLIVSTASGRACYALGAVPTNTTTTTIRDMDVTAERARGRVPHDYSTRAAGARRHVWGCQLPSAWTAPLYEHAIARESCCEPYHCKLQGIGELIWQREAAEPPSPVRVYVGFRTYRSPPRMLHTCVLLHTRGLLNCTHPFAMPHAHRRTHLYCSHHLECSHHPHVHLYLQLQPEEPARRSPIHPIPRSIPLSKSCYTTTFTRPQPHSSRVPPRAPVCAHPPHLCNFPPRTKPNGNPNCCPVHLLLLPRQQGTIPGST